MVMFAFTQLFWLTLVLFWFLKITGALDFDCGMRVGESEISTAEFLSPR